MSSDKNLTDEPLKGTTPYWGDLEQRDIVSVCENSLTGQQTPVELRLPFLNKEIFVDIQNRRLRLELEEDWRSTDDPLLELICVLYLLNAGPGSLSQNMIGVKELKSAHFFTGPHELRIQPLLDRYGNDLEGFKRAAENQGGEILNLADVAYRFFAFPKVPLYYLLWKGDEEFPPGLSILFDRSIEQHLPPDAILGLANLVSGILLKDDARY